MPPGALRRTRPVTWGTTWDEVEAAMLGSPADADVVEHLVEALRRDGRFREPVVIDPTDRSVLDGTHRVVAALRAGVAIDVTWADPESCPDSELREVRLAVEVVDAELARAWSIEDDDELVATMAAVSALGSIPAEGGWLRTPCISARHDVLEATWFPGAGSQMPDDDRLEALLVARARQAGLRLTVLDIGHDPWWLHEPR